MSRKLPADVPPCLITLGVLPVPQIDDNMLDKEENKMQIEIKTQCSDCFHTSPECQETLLLVNSLCHLPCTMMFDPTCR